MVRKWYSNQKGSVFLVVLTVILIATFLMFSIFLLTMQSLSQKKTVQNTAQAFRNAESAINLAQSKINAAFSSVKTYWANNPTAQATTILQMLQTNLAPLNNQKVSVNQVFDYTISCQFPQTISNGTLQIPIVISATGYDGAIKKQLQQSLTITSVIQSLAYAVYAPDTIFLSGGVYIDGNIATSSKSSSNSIYVSDYPWLGTLTSGDNFVPKTSGVQNSVYRPITVNGLEKPSFSTQSLLTTGNVYKYTSYYDLGIHWDWNLLSFVNGTYYFGQPSQVFDKLVVDTNLLGTIFTKVPVISMQAPTFDSTYITNVVNNQFNNMNTYNGITNITASQLATNLSNGATINNPIHVTNGDVSIASNQTLSVNGPVFIDGNLDVQGTLNVNGVIYVKGNVSIHNLSPQQVGANAPRLQIWALGSVVANVVVKGKDNSQIPTSPIQWKAFLASANPMFLGGAFGFYQITGGVTAPTVILNASYGKSLKYDGVNVINQDPKDTTPRLTITSDPTLVTQPMAGTPTMADLNLEPVGGPVLIGN